MKIFISWSKPVSNQIAKALRNWVPVMFESVEPYMSDHDNEAGARWNQIISSELSGTDFGIICLTPDNLASPWLLFEAGALSKSVTSSRVVPLLYELTPANIESPLSQFMGKTADKDGLRDIVHTINNALPRPRSERSLDTAFDLLWPELLSDLEQVRVPAPIEVHERPDRDLLEEALEILRGLRTNFNSQASATAKLNPYDPRILGEGIQGSATDTSDPWAQS